MYEFLNSNKTLPQSLLFSKDQISYYINQAAQRATHSTRKYIRQLRHQVSISSFLECTSEFIGYLLGQKRPGFLHPAGRVIGTGLKGKYGMGLMREKDSISVDGGIFRCSDSQFEAMIGKALELHAVHMD